jgi:hypothetical protein
MQSLISYKLYNICKKKDVELLFRTGNCVTESGSRIMCLILHIILLFPRLMERKTYFTLSGIPKEFREVNQVADIPDSIFAEP